MESGLESSTTYLGQDGGDISDCELMQSQSIDEIGGFSASLYNFDFAKIHSQRWRHHCDRSICKYIENQLVIKFRLKIDNIMLHSHYK